MAELFNDALAYIASMGALGGVAFILLFAACCLALLPISFLTLGAGAVFGLGPGFALVLAGLVAFGALVEPAGFPRAVAALFALVARGMGSRTPGRDVLIGMARAASAYLVFAHGLGLPLSWGGALQAALGGRP
jgi:apolipoprotein N-acyltransferase